MRYFENFGVVLEIDYVYSVCFYKGVMCGGLGYVGYIKMMNGLFSGKVFLSVIEESYVSDELGSGICVGRGVFYLNLCCFF